MDPRGDGGVTQPTIEEFLTLAALAISDGAKGGAATCAALSNANRE